MKFGILNMAVFTVSLEMSVGERLIQTMWWKKKEAKHQNIIIYPCLKCHYQIKAPKDYIDQFKPGGREYHLDGKSYLHCPKCGEAIEIK